MTSATTKLPADQKYGWADRPWRYVVLSLYWFPISLFWGMMLGQILPGRVEDFAGAHKGAYLGIIGGIGAAASAVIQLVIGPISDRCRSRLGRRHPFILVGTVIACAAMWAFGRADSFVGLALSYFTIQLALNVANGPYNAYMPDLTPLDRQGAASAVLGIMSLLGKAGGPLVAGIAVQKAMVPYASLVPTPTVLHLAGIARAHAFQQLLNVDVALFLICAVITVAVLPDWPAQGDETVGAAIRGIFQWDLRRNSNFFRLLVSRGVYNLGFYIALTYLQYYVQDSLHQGLNYAGPQKILQVITIGGALLGTFPAGLMADRTSKKRVVYVSCAFSAAAVVIFALAHSVLIAYVFAVAFGIGYGAFCAVDWAFACNLLPEGGPAKFMAVWSLSDTIPQVLAPAFGPIADVLNRTMGVGDGWRAAMLVAAVSVVCGAVVIRGVVERAAAGAVAV